MVQALFEGEKQWTFFDEEDTHLLYPSYTHSFDASFQVDLASPDFTQHPLLRLARPRRCTLRPVNHKLN